MPATTASYASVGINTSVQGDIQDANDQDYFAVSLVAGQSYIFDVDGTTLSDPTLTLRNGAGAQLAFNDDGGPGLDSRIEFTAGSSGMYFLDVGGYSANTGSYSLATRIDDVSDDVNSIDTIAVNGVRSGQINSAADQDFFQIFLIGGSELHVRRGWGRPERPDAGGAQQRRHSTGVRRRRWRRSQFAYQLHRYHYRDPLPRCGWLRRCDRELQSVWLNRGSAPFLSTPPTLGLAGFPFWLCRCEDFVGNNRCNCHSVIPYRHAGRRACPASTSVARPALQDVDAGPSPGMTRRTSASLEVIWSFPRRVLTRRAPPFCSHWLRRL